jgi:hypothetical protein
MTTQAAGVTNAGLGALRILTRINPINGRT